MLKKLLLVMLLGVGILTFASSYTAPTYDSINFTLCSGYTAPTYDSINFSLGESDSCITDTCSCAGLNNDWEVDMEDFCVITDDCDLGTGKLSFINTGNFTVAAAIDTTDMGDPGSGGIVWMDANGIINVN